MDEDTRDARLADIESRIGLLEGRVDLDQVQDEIVDLEVRLSRVRRALQRLRSLGYRYAPELEGRLQALAEAWPDVRSEAESRLRVLTTELNGERRLAEIRRRVAWARDEDDFDDLDSALDDLAREVDDAVDQVRDAFEPFEAALKRVQQVIAHLTWAVEQAASATFPWGAGEHLVDACEAQWLTQGDKGPKGVLYLSNARLIFERREKVTTRKVLFVPVARKLVREMLFAAPIRAVQVTEVQDARGGFLGLGKRELLTLRITTASAQGRREMSVRLRLLKGADNQAWAVAIQRVQRGALATVAGASKPSTTAPAE